jgi:polyisoprenoid-binding protein YceI
VLLVAFAPGTHRVGPDNGSLRVRTYREGVAAKAGHDLVLEVTRWDATVDVGDDRGVAAVSLDADSRSLEVRRAERGVKPLTDKDRADIRRNIDEKVLRGEPIAFRSRTVRAGRDGRLVVDGDLTIAGTTRPVTAELLVGSDGTAGGTISLAQSGWGIRPYRGLMGALKVRDEVVIEVAAEPRG